MLWLAGGLLLAGCYDPPIADCTVRCAKDGTCPNGMECSGDFCRPFEHDVAACSCRPGEQRLCGGGQGECTPGLQTCGENKVWTPCEGEVLPAPERCDLKDNDCDGDIDETPADAPACELRQGVCAKTVHACVDGQYSATCLAEYGSNYEAVETKCDGKDNDCDGTVDGRAAGTLVNSSTGFAMVGVTGGYALAWGKPSGGGVDFVARFYDPALVALGSEIALGTAPSGSLLQGASFGTRAWFVWQTLGAGGVPSDVGGATVDFASPTGPSVALTGTLRADMRGKLSVGASAIGLVAAWPTDAGVGISEWSGANPTATVRLVVPPVSGFLGASAVTLSNKASTIGLAGVKLADGGTDDFRGILSLADGGYSTKNLYVGAIIIDAPNRTEAVYDGFCDYDVAGYSCHKSYLYVDFDVWNPTALPREVRTDKVGSIGNVFAAPSGTDALLTWIEANGLYLGTLEPGSLAIAARPVATPGVTPLASRVASTGGILSALVYSSGATTGKLDALLVCSP